MSGTDVQIRIDRAMRALGGYWPPLAVLARVLEELGELASANGPEERRQEAADCAVATLALANQYCVEINRCSIPERASGEVRALIAAGQLARLINRFEGVKPPKPSELGMVELTTIFARLLDGLAESGGLCFDELLEFAAVTAEANAERDAGRFTARVDPVTAPVRELFWGEVVVGRLSPVVGVWGSIGNAACQRDEVERFLRVDAAHPLAGLVFGPLADANELYDTALRITMLSGSPERVRMFQPRNTNAASFVLLTGSASRLKVRTDSELEDIALL